MRKIIPHTFFARDTRRVAQDLLGMYLVREVDGRRIESMITETEAYHGWHDKASHGRSGKTKRTEPMFAPPGIIYVYLVYGMHHCLNISTMERNFPAAVLIRGTAEVSGPGRLTRHFEIKKGLTGMSLGKKTGLWVEQREMLVTQKNIKKTPRIGVDYAGASREWKWRYLLT